MPARTVTVCASGSSATTSSIGFRDRKLSVLSAMLLKQWRVPSTFNLCCFLTYFRTSSSELAESKRSVLYSRLPAQFFSLSCVAQANSGEIAGLAITAEKSLIKVLLFIALAQAESTLTAGISSSLASKTRQLYTYFLSFQRALIRLVGLECATRTTLKNYFCQSSTPNTALWDKQRGLTVPLY